MTDRQQSLFLFAVILGVLGGAGLITTFLLTHRGPMVFIPYLAMLIAVVVYFRRRVTTFAQRFNAALVAYLVANVIGLVYVDATIHRVGERSVLQIIWPLAAMLVIGIAASALIAVATPTRSTAH